MGITDLQMVLQSFSHSEHQVLQCDKENSLFKPDQPKPKKANKKQASQLLGKRKRKTERELQILKRELQKNFMWTRESIKEMRAKYQADFSMSEQQIYKWWWDQTRKRAKHQAADNSSAVSVEDTPEGIPLITFHDEFGGYSSRLRQSNSKKAKIEEENDNMEVNLCQLLGINVDAIALRIAMGLDEVADEDSTSSHCNSELQQRPTVASMGDKSFASPNDKRSTLSELIDSKLNSRMSKSRYGTPRRSSNQKTAETGFSSRKLSILTESK